MNIIPILYIILVLSWFILAARFFYKLHQLNKEQARRERVKEFRETREFLKGVPSWQSQHKNKYKN